VRRQGLALQDSFKVIAISQRFAHLEPSVFFRFGFSN